MRHYALTAAALAALAFASASAHAQGSAAKIQQLCPDMTFNQIGAKVAELAQKYDFDSDPDTAAQQAAGLICPQAREPQAAQEPARPRTTPAVIHPGMMLPPPPHRLPPPPVLRIPPPQALLAPLRRPLPPPAYSRPVPGPMVAGAYRYPEERVRPLAHQRVRGEPFCMAEVDPEAFERKYPRPRPYCEIGAIPNKPCPGWVCRSR